MQSILFVCIGNICRSPAAEALVRHFAKQKHLENEIYCASRGIESYHVGESADPRMQQALKKRGIAISHIAKQISQKDFEEFDVILASSEDVCIYLNDICPEEHKKKIKKMTYCSQQFLGQDVPDPYIGSDAGFDHVLDILEDCCLELTKSLK